MASFSKQLSKRLIIWKQNMQVFPENIFLLIIERYGRLNFLYDHGQVQIFFTAGYFPDKRNKMTLTEIVTI